MAAHYIKNPAKFLVEKGILYHLNRVFFTPFGYALCVEWPETDAEKAEADNSNVLRAHVIDLKKSTDFEGVTDLDPVTEQAFQKFRETATATRRGE